MFFFLEENVFSIVMMTICDFQEFYAFFLLKEIETKQNKKHGSYLLITKKYII